MASRTIPLDSRSVDRAKALEADGYDAFDALRLSVAESAGLGVLLTTDDRFIKRAAYREIGPDGLARFLRLNRSGKADYTRDRSSWQQGLTVEQIVASINGHPQE